MDRNQKPDPRYGMAEDQSGRHLSRLSHDMVPRGRKVQRPHVEKAATPAASALVGLLVTHRVRGGDETARLPRPSQTTGPNPGCPGVTVALAWLAGKGGMIRWLAPAERKGRGLTCSSSGARYSARTSAADSL